MTPVRVGKDWLRDKELVRLRRIVRALEEAQRTLVAEVSRLRDDLRTEKVARQLLQINFDRLAEVRDQIAEERDKRDETIREVQAQARNLADALARAEWQADALKKRCV